MNCKNHSFTKNGSWIAFQKKSGQLILGQKSKQAITSEIYVQLVSTLDQTSTTYKGAHAQETSHFQIRWSYKFLQSHVKKQDMLLTTLSLLNLRYLQI